MNYVELTTRTSMMSRCDEGHILWDYETFLNVFIEEMVLLRPPHMIKQYETKKVWLQTLLYDSKHNLQKMSRCDAEQDFYKKLISKTILP